MKIISIYLFTFSIAVFLIAAHYGYGIWNIGMHSPVSSVKASQYKFLTEMIFCFLNLSLLLWRNTAASQESERAHLHQSSRSSVLSTRHISQQYIAKGPFIKSFSLLSGTARGEPSGVVWIPDLAGQEAISSPSSGLTEN